MTGYGPPRTRRRLRLLGPLAVLLAVLALAMLLSAPRGPISRATCNRIHDGMTERQVESLLGGPAGGSEPIVRANEDDILVPTGMVIKRWTDGSREIVLVVHEGGTVSGAVYAEDTWWRRVRRRLGL